MVGIQFAIDGVKKQISPVPFLLWHGTGVALLLALSAFLAWGHQTPSFLAKAWLMIALTLLAHSLALIVSLNLQRVPRRGNLWLVFLSVSAFFLGAVALIALARVYYSRTFLGVAYILSLLWIMLGYRVSKKTHSPKLAVIPGGMAGELLNLSGISWMVLDACVLHRQVDGVVVDLHQKLSTQWVRFISNCSLKRVPVFHAAVVFEGATGRVSLSHLSEGVLDDFELSPIYVTMKRAVDVLLAGIVGCLSLPFLLPLMAAIRLDSHGPVFFMQERVSQGGRSFRMIKFRTMRKAVGAEGKAEARFATDENARITKLGRFLRRYRLDELPQIWNILRGDMSFIGPRPEQIPFVRRFETEIPFYSYRHLVKPGLTGWAQVTQGYAAGTDQTRAKLEHDLYYIKYFSFWLDLWILGKTLRTVLTGFGAR